MIGVVNLNEAQIGGHGEKSRRAEEETETEAEAAATAAAAAEAAAAAAAAAAACNCPGGPGGLNRAHAAVRRLGPEGA